MGDVIEKIAPGAYHCHCNSPSISTPKLGFITVFRNRPIHTNLVSKMTNRSVLAGMEVPVIGSDSTKWLQLTVTSTTPSQPPFSPPNEDAAVIGTPPTYLIWRIHKSQPRQLEIVEFCGDKGFPRVGLQIQFPDALSPFAVICGNETHHGSGYPYMLYALTVSGVAYLIKLKPCLSCASSSVLPQTDVMDLNVKLYFHYEAITAAAATAGFFIVGGDDGSVCCFQFGSLDPSVPGFVHEMRDDAGFSRLWGLVPRKLEWRWSMYIDSNLAQGSR